MGAKIKNLPTLKITEVTPMAIGVGLAGNKIDVLIPRNTPKPCSSKYVAYQSSQSRKGIIKIPVYEGDETRASDCFPVNTFNIEVDPNTKSRVWQKIEVNENSISVLAFIGDEMPRSKKDEERLKRLEIKTDKSVFLDDEIGNMRIKQKELMTPPTPEQAPYHQLLISVCNNVKAVCNKIKITDAKQKREKKKEMETILKEVKQIANSYEESENMSEEEFYKQVNYITTRMKQLYGPSYKPPPISLK